MGKGERRVVSWLLGQRMLCVRRGGVLGIEESSWLAVGAENGV